MHAVFSTNPNCHFVQQQIPGYFHAMSIIVSRHLFFELDLAWIESAILNIYRVCDGSTNHYCIHGSAHWLTRVFQLSLVEVFFASHDNKELGRMGVLIPRFKVSSGERSSI